MQLKGDEPLLSTRIEECARLRLSLPSVLRHLWNIQVREGGRKGTCSGGGGGTWPDRAVGAGGATGGATEESPGPGGPYPKTLKAHAR